MDLTPRQQRERDEFDELYGAKLPALADLNRFDDRTVFGPWNQYWRIHDFVRRHAKPGTRLLSYGCGQGISAVAYARAGCFVCGFDVSGAGVHYAQQLAKLAEVEQNTEFSVQVAESLSYPDDYFDVVEGANILHHVDLPIAMRELHRVMKPGGVAIFKDSLATPVRDRVRRLPPLSFVLPAPGVKNARLGVTYHTTPDEHPLSSDDLAVIRRTFRTCRIEKFRVLALLSTFVKKRTWLEKCDLWLFRVFPPARALGDHVILTLTK